MMRKSAGILLYRKQQEGLEFFLVHPGGPFWKNKDAGAWSVPKGEIEEEEDSLVAARREFKEETGIDVDGEFITLTPVKQKSGKLVIAWALQKNIDPAILVSNTFALQWPPNSGKYIDVPEVDKGGWFTMDEARNKIIPGQVPILIELSDLLKS
jgi:predicted NUDIX family NTP pyrophosphohydrolase